MRCVITRWPSVSISTVASAPYSLPVKPFHAYILPFHDFSILYFTKKSITKPRYRAR